MKGISTEETLNYALALLIDQQPDHHFTLKNSDLRRFAKGGDLADVVLRGHLNDDGRSITLSLESMHDAIEKVLEQSLFPEGVVVVVIDDDAQRN